MAIWANSRPNGSPECRHPRTGCHAAAELKPLDSNFAGLVIYTSGSTGVAQAIPKNLSQMSAEIATLETQFGDVIDDADIVATVSHQHIYGLLFNVLWPLSAGRAFAARSFGSFEGLDEDASPTRLCFGFNPCSFAKITRDSGLGACFKTAPSSFFIRRSFAGGCRSRNSAITWARAD